MNYNKKEGNRKQQKLGISPAIATVILIAITLVAGVAIGGFVFGLFGSQTTTAQVTSTAASIPVSYVNGTGVARPAMLADCSATKGNLKFANTGSTNTAISSIAITYGGKTVDATPGGSCTITAGGSLYIYVWALPDTGVVTLGPTASSGAVYVGEAQLTNGARVPFTGTFR